MNFKKVSLGLFMCLFTSLLFSQYHIPFQGKLYLNGSPVNASKSFQFTLKDGSTSLWASSRTLDVVNGIYAVILGGQTAIMDNPFQGRTSVQLEILVDGAMLDPVELFPPIESDPTVPEELKDGVDWVDIQNLPMDFDSSATNELQLLTLEEDTLSLSNGNSVVLKPQADTLILNRLLQIGDTSTQASMVENLSGTLSTSNVTSAWQSFRLIQGGQLTSFQVQFNYIGNTSISLKIYEGEGNSNQATVLPIKTFNTSELQLGTVLQTLNLADEAITLLPDATYTFEITGDQENITFDITTNDSYSNGITSIDPSNDLLFRINTSFLAPSILYADTTQVTTSGRFKDKTGFVMPVGTIIAYAGETVPEGWLFCDNRAVLRDAYPDLFAAIGTSWGAGDGVTTFKLPDLRGYFLRGRDAGTGRDPDADSRNGTSGGNTGDQVGSYQDGAFQEHSHIIFRTGQYNDPNDWGGPFIAQIVNRTGGNDKFSYSMIAVDDTPNFGQTSLVGGSETRPLNAYVNYIIKY